MKGYRVEIGVVVRDIEQATQEVARLLDCPAPEIYHSDVIHGEYRGQPDEIRTCLAYFDLGGAYLKLIEEAGAPSSFTEQLDATGEGVHHIALFVDDLPAQEKRMEAMGIEAIQRHPSSKVDGVFWDTRATLKTMLELVRLNKQPGA